MKNIIKVTLAYLAAVIGAGFASGSETVYYFVRFGNISFAGVVLSALGFGFVAYELLVMCMKYKVNDFESLMRLFCGERVAKLTCWLMCIFMLILLGAMISAFAEMLDSIANVPMTLSAAGFCVLCYCILCMPGDKIVRWGGIAGFLIFCMIVFCVMYMLKNRTVNVFSNFNKMATSSAVYTAYNAFAVCPVLCEWSQCLKSKRECKVVGVVSCALSFCSLILIWGIINVFYGKINLGELPMLTLATRQGRGFLYVYVFVIFVSVLSSAVANAYGICLRFRCYKNNMRLISLFVICSGWLISSLGFTEIVTVLYEYTGYGVLMLTIYCIIKLEINRVYVRKNKKY